VIRSHLLANIYCAGGQSRVREQFLSVTQRLSRGDERANFRTIPVAPVASLTYLYQLYPDLSISKMIIINVAR